MTTIIYDQEKYGHWGVLEHFDIADHRGFVYRITNLTNNKQYIGQKLFWFSVKRPPLKGKKRARRSKKVSDWHTYTGSSVSLNADVEEIGLENFKFEILSLHANKWEMNYTETKLIIMEDAIPRNDRYNEFVGKIGRCPKSSKY